MDSLSEANATPERPLANFFTWCKKLQTPHEPSSPLRMLRRKVDRLARMFHRCTKGGGRSECAQTLTIRAVRSKAWCARGLTGTQASRSWRSEHLAPALNAHAKLR